MKWGRAESSDYDPLPPLERLWIVTLAISIVCTWFGIISAAVRAVIRLVA